MRTFQKVSVVAAVALLASSGASAATLNSAFTNVTCAAPISFSASFGLGARSAEVMNLQKILNLSPLTQVSLSGAGSPGLETSYFGPATRAALVKFQKLHLADTRATGFKGPLTNVLLNMVCATASTGTGSTGSTGSTGTTTVGTGLTVTTGTNVGGVIVAGSAQVPVLNFRVSNPTSAPVTINSVKFQKMGILSDSSISNAYLASGNLIVAQYSGISAGILSFNPLNAVIPAGQSLDMTLRVDISSNSSNNNLVSFRLASLSDVVISAGTVGGTVPMDGGNFYVSTVTNPSLATAALSYQNVKSAVDAGTQGVRVSSVTWNVQQSPIKIQSVRFNVSGSINIAQDLANLKLRIDGVESAMVATAPADGKLVFDFGTEGKVIPTGNHSMEVFADVLGTANRNFKLEILRPYDTVAMDTQYRTNISVGTPSYGALTSTDLEISVRAGTATVSLASDTPTGTVALGGSNVPLGKFVMRAAGESLRVKYLPFSLSFGGYVPVTGTIDSQVRNIALFADDGTQLGSTINTPSTCTATPAYAGAKYSCSFGSSNSFINYLVPANTTRVFTLRADVQNTATTVTSIRAALEAAVGNVEGQVSFQSTSMPSSAISSSNLTVSQSPFQGVKNSSFGDQPYVGGAAVQKIASFSISASSAEAIDLSSVNIETGANIGGTSQPIKAQSLSVKVGGVTIGNTLSTVAPSSATTFTVSGSPVRISSGSSVTVDVFADLLTGSVAGSYPAVVKLTGATARGASTFSNQDLKQGNTLVTSAAPVNGQALTFVGKGTLTVQSDKVNPAKQQIVQGTSMVDLGVFKFSSNNNEDIRLDRVTLTATTSSTTVTSLGIDGLALYDGVTKVAEGTSLSSIGGGVFTSLFTPTNFVVIKNDTKTLTLRGSPTSFTSAPTSNGLKVNFQIGTLASDVRGVGTASTEDTFLLAQAGNDLKAQDQTLLKAKAKAEFVREGSAGTRGRSGNDTIALLKIAVDNASITGVNFKEVKIKVGGAIAVGGINFQLLDSSDNVVATAAGVTSGSTATLNLVNPINISRGQTSIFKVRVDSIAGTTNAGSATDAVSYQFGVTEGDFTYTAQDETTNINLERATIQTVDIIHD